MIQRQFCWSDLHIDHYPALKHRGWFETLEEYQEDCAEKWDRIVGPQDTIYLVGDIAMTWDGLRWVSKRPGRKILILGNHDKERENSIRDLLSVYDDVEGLMKHRKGFYFSHAPVHVSELRGRRNIHGHTHGKVITDPRYINVCIDIARDGPVDLQDIVSKRYGSFRSE